jgi:glutaredoxin/glutathione-dependent peroxiredoxin
VPAEGRPVALIVDANGGSCHQFRWKISFAGIGGEKKPWAWRAGRRLPARPRYAIGAPPLPRSDAAAPSGANPWRTPFGGIPMTIQIGDKVPAATLKYLGPEGPKEISTDELFSGKKVALFAVPGAFTPTCSQRHLPGYVDKASDLKGKGVDQIVCVSVNDAFVMGAWGKAQDVGDKVLMLADGSGDFTRAVGLELDLTKGGLGKRSQRYSMLVDNGVVTQLNVEKAGQFEVSSADAMLKGL